MVDRRGWGVGKVKARVDQDPGVDKMCGRDGGRVSRTRRILRRSKMCNGRQNEYLCVWGGGDRAEKWFRGRGDWLCGTVDFGTV